MQGDQGQTLPLYIWLTGILLLAALAFFAFAQGAAVRGTTQTAADAAALAAAQQARDDLITALGDGVTEGDDWLAWLDGELPEVTSAGAAAQELAAANEATVIAGPQPSEARGYHGYRVEVRSIGTVGDSVIPGTETMRAEAAATAVIEPLCDYDPDADPEEPVELDCDGQVVEIDPDDFDPDVLPDPTTMFSVYLAE
ncbi:hypothetical protein ABT026_23225 [Streptomyces sp. NPDC002734]|uniref:hypothetical protein n=1 Tax=Streptomyces sp. NPDC002734 TaxID=3154426 RepID=UPI00332EED18